MLHTKHVVYLTQFIPELDLVNSVLKQVRNDAYQCKTMIDEAARVPIQDVLHLFDTYQAIPPMYNFIISTRMPRFAYRFVYIEKSRRSGSPYMFLFCNLDMIAQTLAA